MMAPADPAAQLVFCTLTLFVSLTNVVDGLAIDNEVIGIPQVQCSEDAVVFSVRSRNPFTGNIYIKGKYNDPTCRQEFFSNTYNGASLTIRIPQCGMRRIRQLQPQGMNYIVVFVVNFHPQFVTKVDRAYNVRCFYAQQEKTVTSQLEVSMLATQSLEAATMLMPNCEYSVRADTLNGPRIRYVRVGDRLVHRWECDNPNFGMLVKNCFVNDGYGSSVRVLDSRGCPVFTPVIQGTLQYDNSLNLAYVEVWAYKFPDRSDLFFQCQIQVCNKRENECIGVTPPNCPLIPKSGFTPSSFVDPNNPGAVTGSFVTFVRGTFPEVGGQLVAGGYPQSAYVYPGGLRPAVVETVGRQIYGAQQAVLNNQVGAQSFTGATQETPNNFPRAKPFSAASANQWDQQTTGNSFYATNPVQEFVTPRVFNDRANQQRGNKVVKRESDDKEKEMKKPVNRTYSHTDNEVMDVASEVVYVADVTDNNEDSAALRRLNSDSDQKQICLNPMALSVLLICFAILVIIIAVLLVYLLSKSARLKTTTSKWSSLLSMPSIKSARLPCIPGARGYQADNNT